MKKWLSVLLAIVMLCAGFAVQAETRKTEYVGGVVLRTFPKGNEAPGDAYINVGYLECSAPYLLLGQTITWQLGVEGGQAPYDITLELYRRPIEQTMGSYWYYDAISIGDQRSFTYVFEEPGDYLWEITITDANGQTLVFQPRPMKTVEERDETDALTVAGKVNQIIAQEITAGMSEYQRALVLHDWLIYNANYDYTYSWYEPEGVLLHGTGVCDSYARAYQMLCTAAGLQCIYVSGFGNGGAHGWNLVKVGGNWYHVDCTWDDPGYGGAERHTYFLLTDAEIGIDHDWNVADRGDMFVPDANDTFFEGSSGGGYDFTFSTFDDFASALCKMMAAGEFKPNIVALYTGDQSILGVYEDFREWAREELNNVLGSNGWWSGWRASGSRFELTVQWNDPKEYIRFNEDKVLVSVGESKTVPAADYYPVANAFTWTISDPAVASVSAAYDEQNGLRMTVTGLSAGTAVITATSRDGLSDTVTVTVLPAHHPDIHVEEEAMADGLRLSWPVVPGATEYHVHIKNAGQDQEECLMVVSENEAYLTKAQMPAQETHEVWIVARRVVNGEIVAEYCGEHTRHSGHNAPLQHTPVTDAAVAATCTQTGLTAGSHCAVCGTIIVAQEVVPALGHAEVTVPGVPATHVTAGMTDGLACSRCGETLRAQETIPAVRAEIFAVPDFVAEIDAEAFAGCRFECVVIGGGCRSIGARAFADNPDLRFAEIPASVSTIDASAFDGCSAELVIVTTAGSAAEAFAQAQGILCVIR